MKNLFAALLVSLFLAISPNLFSQNVSINADGSLADTSAMLDISSTTKGVLLPRMTTTQQNAIILPANGLTIFNTTLNSIMINTGTSVSPVWSAVTAGSIDTSSITNFSTKVRSLFSSTTPITYSNGLIGITQATTSTNGYLSSTDWNTFNNKAAAFTKGNLTETGSGVLTITGGTNSVIGSGTTVQVKQATTSQNGFLSSTDWNTFNNKQPAGSYLTSNQTITLSGDVTGSGITTITTNVGKINGTSLASLGTGILKNTTGTGVPSIAIASDFPTLNQNTTGSAATLTTGRTISITGDLAYTSPAFNGSSNVTAAGTLATVNANVGSFTNANITVNAKGLITAASNGSSGTVTNIATGYGLSGGPITSTGTIIVDSATLSLKYLRRVDSVNSITGYTTLYQNSLKQNQLNGTGFVKATGTTISYDNSTYLTSIDTTNIANFSTKVRSLLSSTAPITYSNGLIGITQATTSTNGFLSSTDWNTFNNKQTQLNGTGFVKATGTTISYDNSTYLTANQTISFAPTGDVTGSTTGTTTLAPALTIGANKVTNAKLAQMPTLTIKGNNTGGTANAADLTVAQVNAILPVFTSTLNGLVPFSGGSAGKVLHADGVWRDTASAGNQWSITGNSGTSYLTNFLGTTDNKSLRFRTNNTQQMKIDSTGSVAIGQDNFDATNPEKVVINAGATGSVNGLVVKGSIDNYFQFNIKNQSATASATTDIVATADNGTETTNYVDLGINGSAYNGGAIETGVANDGYLISAAKDFYLVNSTPNRNLLFLTGGTGVANERLRILANGYVGLGVQDPGAQFVVKDTIQIRRTGAVSQLLFTNTAGTGDFRIGGDGGDIFWQGGGGRDLQMGSYWSTILTGDRQTSTYPGFISNTSGTGVIVLGQRDASVPLGVQANSASQTANLTEWRNSSGTVLDAFDKSGNLGVGNSSPSQKLDVTGNIKFSGALMPGGSAGNSGDILVSSGAGSNPTWTSTGSYLSSNAWILDGNSVSSVKKFGTTSNYDLPFITNNTEKMRITNDGSVGIGTSTFNASYPEQLLVDAGSTGSTAYQNVIVGKGNTNSYAQLNIQNTKAGSNASSDVVATSNNGNESVNYIDMGINSGSNSSSGVIGAANTGYLYTTGNDFAIGNATSNKNLIFFTGGTASSNEAMRIDGNGNVGIATTSPNSTLQNTGSFSQSIISTSSSYSVLATDYTVVCNGSGVTKTITLPTASGITGRIYVIKRTGTANVTVATFGSQTIDGAGSKSLATQYNQITVQSDGSNWVVLSN